MKTLRAIGLSTPQALPARMAQEAQVRSFLAEKVEDRKRSVQRRPEAAVLGVSGLRDRTLPLWPVESLLKRSAVGARSAHLRRWSRRGRLLRWTTRARPRTPVALRRSRPLHGQEW